MSGAAAVRLRGRGGRGRDLIANTCLFPRILGGGSKIVKPRKKERETKGEGGREGKQSDRNPNLKCIRSRKERGRQRRIAVKLLFFFFRFFLPSLFPAVSKVYEHKKDRKRRRLTAAISDFPSSPPPKKQNTQNGKMENVFRSTPAQATAKRSFYTYCCVHIFRRSKMFPDPPPAITNQHEGRQSEIRKEDRQRRKRKSIQSTISVLLFDCGNMKMKLSREALSSRVPPSPPPTLFTNGRPLPRPPIMTPPPPLLHPHFHFGFG